MSSQHPHHPHGELVNENVHHEESDINVRAILTFIVVLTVVVLAMQGLSLGLFKLFDKIEEKTEPAVSPLTAAPAKDGSDFPAPSLQRTPWADLKKLRAEEAAHLNGYGWVDQSAGVGRIPIARAKALLLEKGLPVRPEPVDATAGTHVAATGESSGGRNLPATGPQGTTGASGAQGAEGAHGATGASGATGAHGATGATGAHGAAAKGPGL